MSKLPKKDKVTDAEAAAIREHAKLIFVKMSKNITLTQTNELGHVTDINTSIDLAELFHHMLKHRGYKNE